MRRIVSKEVHRMCVKENKAKEAGDLKG